MSRAATRSPRGGARPAVPGAVTTPLPAADRVRREKESRLLWLAHLAQFPDVERAAVWKLRLGACRVWACSFASVAPARITVPGDACAQIQPELLEVKPKTSSFSALAKAAGRAEARAGTHSRLPQSTCCVLTEPSEAPAPPRRRARAAPVSGAAPRAEQLLRPPSQARAAHSLRRAP